MPLAAMQHCLTELYGLELDYRVDDFLITDRWLASALGGGARAVEEELLIVEQDGEAEVSLYLAEGLMARLAVDDPTAALSESNLADFWIAFEGVSHFTYFVFNASRDRSVSLLELELQAEVDKFVATAAMLRNQGGRAPSGLHHWLFELPRLHEDLSPVEIERYQRANHYAAKYCRRIWPQVRSDTAGENLKRELAHFYRLPREHKIGLIESS